MILAIKNQGVLGFVLYEQTMRVRVLFKFKRRLIQDSSRELILLFDNLKVHQANLVRRCLDMYQEKI